MYANPEFYSDNKNSTQNVSDKNETSDSSNLNDNKQQEFKIYPECRVVAPDARAARLIGIINRTLSEDYGDFWMEKMLPALENLNFINIEERVFLEGEPTQASWPVLHDYEFITETTTLEPTEEYPGLLFHLKNGV